MTSERIKQIHNYVPVYDLARGLASLGVFFSHLKPVILALTGLTPEDQYPYKFFEVFGVLGVEFFFALSGLLLGPILYKHFQKGDTLSNIKVFLMRRWYRTLPAYYFGFIIYYAVFIHLKIEMPEYWPLFLVFLQNPLSMETKFYVVSWSLSIEEIFYIVFPALVFLIWLITGRADKAFIGSVIILIIFCFAMRVYNLIDSEDVDTALRRGFLLRLDSIAIGVLIGIYYKNISKAAFLVSVVFILGTAVYVVLYWQSFDIDILRMAIAKCIFTFIPLACAVCIQYLALNVRMNKSRVITFLADISYPLYIFHLPILYMFFPENSYPSPEKLVFYIWTSIGLSYLFFRYVETPILKRRPSYC